MPADYIFHWIAAEVTRNGWPLGCDYSVAVCRVCGQKKVIQGAHYGVEDRWCRRCQGMKLHENQHTWSAAQQYNGHGT